MTIKAECIDNLFDKECLKNLKKLIKFVLAS